MAESIARFFVDNLDGKVSSEIIAFIISMLPILELRGGPSAIEAVVALNVGENGDVPVALHQRQRGLQLLQLHARHKLHQHKFRVPQRGQPLLHALLLEHRRVQDLRAGEELHVVSPIPAVAPRLIQVALVLLGIKGLHSRRDVRRCK